MARRIEDYALIGNCQTAALVGRDGSLDWLCLPRFDSDACFASLLGKPENGRWLLAPAGAIKKTTRRYRDGTLILETDFETDDGAVRLVDCMPPRRGEPDLVRVVQGLRGHVKMRMELIIRFGFGSIGPWGRGPPRGPQATARPDALVLDTAVELHGKHLTTVAKFTVAKGQEIPFVLMWYPSNQKRPRPLNASKIIKGTGKWWRKWSARCTYEGPYRDAVLRSLITL